MICYFGHHRSGSSYIRSILESVALLTGRSSKTIHDLKDFEPERETSLLIATNGSIEHTHTIPFEKAFHVIRDPRDVAVSAYYSHLLSHKTDVWKELIDHREELKKMSKEEGLAHEIEVCRKQQFLDMMNWNYNQKNILELKFEQLINDIQGSWTQIFDFLGIQFSDCDINFKSSLIYRSNKLVKKLEDWMPNIGFSNFYLQQIPCNAHLSQFLQKNEFNARTGRKPGDENVDHHYRKGVANDWKNHFTSFHKKIFKEKWGDLLIKLDYEQNHDW